MEIDDCPSINDVAKDGNINLLKYLIEHVGISVNSADNPRRWTPLHFAVNYNRNECVDYLLSLDETQINAVSRCNETPLKLACRNAAVPSAMVQKLITAGADVNYVEHSYHIIPVPYCICQCPKVYPEKQFDHDNLEKAEIVISNGANLLFKAIANKDLDLLKIFLYAGADTNQCRGYTPIIYAARENNYRVFKELIPFVADVNAKDFDGLTALMVAENEDIIKLLLDHGADPNITEDKGCISAFHIAAYERNLNKLILLLPRTRDSTLRSCELYNLIDLVTSKIYNHGNLRSAFDCLRYLMTSNIDNSIFLIPFRNRFTYPSIAALFIKCVLTASNDLWEEYLTLFYLFLSKGINVNEEDSLLVYFAEVYHDWNSRAEQILKILLDQGLNADRFVAFFFSEKYVRRTIKYQMKFVMYLVPYFFSNGYRFYKHFQKSGQDMNGLLSCSEFEQTFATDNLKNYCRSVIRKQIKLNANTTSDYLRILNSLKIPKDLKDYIRFKFY